MRGEIQVPTISIPILGNSLRRSTYVVRTLRLLRALRESLVPTNQLKTKENETNSTVLTSKGPKNKVMTYWDGVEC